MIKAIETRYKGYRFRSRLEARWAVAFDTIGHEYLYEYEGFELPSGRYLPDFYFPHLNAWGEVKPCNFTQEELQKCAELVLHTKKVCILLVGMPETTNYYYLFGFGDDWPHTEDAEILEGVGCDDCDLWWRPERLYVNTGEGNSFTMDRFFIHTNDEPALAAKAARFEFGESG